MRQEILLALGKPLWWLLLMKLPAKVVSLGSRSQGEILAFDSICSHGSNASWLFTSLQYLALLFSSFYPCVQPAADQYWPGGWPQVRVFVINRQAVFDLTRPIVDLKRIVFQHLFPFPVWRRMLDMKAFFTWKKCNKSDCWWTYRKKILVLSLKQICWWFLNYLFMTTRNIFRWK